MIEPFDCRIGGMPRTPHEEEQLMQALTIMDLSMRLRMPLHRARAKKQ